MGLQDSKSASSERAKQPAGHPTLTASQAASLADTSSIFVGISYLLDVVIQLPVSQPKSQRASLPACQPSNPRTCRMESYAVSPPPNDSETRQSCTEVQNIYQTGKQANRRAQLFTDDASACSYCTGTCPEAERITPAHPRTARRPWPSATATWTRPWLGSSAPPHSVYSAISTGLGLRGLSEALLSGATCDTRRGWAHRLLAADSAPFASAPALRCRAAPVVLLTARRFRARVGNAAKACAPCALPSGPRGPFRTASPEDRAETSVTGWGRRSRGWAGGLAHGCLDARMCECPDPRVWGRGDACVGVLVRCVGRMGRVNLVCEIAWAEGYPNNYMGTLARECVGGCVLWCLCAWHRCVCVCMCACVCVCTNCYDCGRSRPRVW